MDPRCGYRPTAPSLRYLSLWRCWELRRPGHRSLHAVFLGDSGLARPSVRVYVHPLPLHIWMWKVPRLFGPISHGTSFNDLLQFACQQFGLSRRGENACRFSKMTTVGTAVCTLPARRTAARQQMLS